MIKKRIVPPLSIHRRVIILHDCAASTALLRSVRVFTLRNHSPDRWHHVVPGAVAVGDDAVDMIRFKEHDIMVGVGWVDELLTSWMLG
jgi:hypothetical protein